jgi:aldose 1-epimerase
MTVMLKLAAGPTEIMLAPEIGGGIACFRHEGVDVMRPATREAIESRNPLGLACFPLVPYSNRIRHGRFIFDGREVRLPLNYGSHPHSIHGHGWQSPWTVEAQHVDRATLVYEHRADAWPWDYRATQSFELATGKLTVRLAIENRSESRMPAGLGLHPYYVRTPRMTLRTKLDGWWETDAEQMPVGYSPAGATDDDWSSWLHGPITTDNVFSGWNGRAVLGWPERGLELTMTADDSARHMVIYAPVEAPFAVIEPVTHPTDALNDPALPDIKLLEPGASFELTTDFSVRTR